MQIDLGNNAYLKHTQNRIEPVVWDSQAAMNGHIMIMGGSGAGKTHLGRKLLADMAHASPNVRIHAFDVHGDIDRLPSLSSVKFSEQCDSGFNPLVVDDNPHCGGVRRRIQAFLAALNRTSRQLGVRQEAVLRVILTDLYAANGFFEDRPDSWRLNDGSSRKYPKKYPTLADAVRFSQAKLRALYLGTNADAAAALEQVNRKAQAIYNRLKSLGEVSAEAVRADPELNKLKEAAAEAYAKAIREIGTGRELNDLIRFDNRDVLRGVVDRLENLNAVGIFRPAPPPFDEGAAIWRYDIKALREDEQKLLVNFRLESLFQQAVAAGVQPEINQVIFLDEAKRFFTDEPDNPINTIATEGRKFGMALVCASQSPTHFSEDFLSNVATKILLRLDEMYWDGSIRKLKIDAKALRYIVPRKTMAVQIKTSHAASARFINVDIKPSWERHRMAAASNGKAATL